MVNDELIKLFAESKIGDAHEEFYRKWKFNTGHILKYLSYEIEQEGEEEGYRGGPSYVIILTYYESLNKFPSKIKTSYKLEDVKREIRELQINKIVVP